MGSVLYNGNPEELYDRIKVLADFRDNNSVFVIDKEDEDIVTVTTSIAGITDIVRLSLELMPIMFRQPLTKFLGISPGGMNATGESDENNWNEYVLSQCEKQLRKPVKRLLELIQYDLFGEVDEKIDFIFKIQSSNDESKEVNNNKIKADTYVQLTTTGIISPEEARKALAEDEKSGFNSIDVDNIPELATSGNEDLFGAFDEWKEENHDRDENGRFKSKFLTSETKETNTEIQAKKDKVYKINFNETKDKVLPNFNSNVIEFLGLPEDNTVRIKENIIFNKNNINHSDITEEDAKQILSEALYEPINILKGNLEHNNRYNFFMQVRNDKYGVVLIEIQKNERICDVINWHFLDNKGYKRKVKKDEKIREKDC